MSKKIILSIAVATLVAGCGSQPTRTNINQPTTNINLSKLKGEKELYVVFSKDKEGHPLSVINMTSTQATALNYFKKSSAIEKNECIRLTENNEATLCDEKTWFAYGQNKKTKLMSRQMRADAEAINPIGIAGNLAISAVSIAEDVLNFDPTLSSARQNLTNGFTKLSPDSNELNAAKNGVIALIYSQYSKEKIQAMSSVDSAINFAKQYPKDDFSSIIESNLSRLVPRKACSDIFRLLTSVPVSPEQKNDSINTLRGFNSFNGFSTAFDLTNDIDDAKKAQSLASSANDKRTIGIKLSKISEQKELASISDLETVFAVEEVGNSVKNGRVETPFLMYTAGGESQDLKAKYKLKVKQMSPFKPHYGAYKVSVRFTMTGTIDSRFQMLFISRNESKPFSQSTKPIDFTITPKNRWADIKEVPFGELISNFGISFAGKEIANVQAKNIKIKFDILSVSTL